MTRVLITGGTGFLGSFVAQKLVPKVEKVIVGDIREPASTISDVEFQKCDVTDRDAIKSLIIRHRIDTVVHLAAIMTPGVDVDFEYKVDVVGSRNVFGVAAEAGVKQIVVSSSGAAYGYHPDSPEWITEATPVKGNDEYSYARHKRLVEETLAGYRKTHPKMKQTIFRIGTILGPTVANQITALWDSKRILKIAGSDSPFVFIWVDDVAEVMARAATGAPAGIYNVAGDGKLSVPDIAQRLNKNLLIIPAWMLALALRVGRALKLTEHGPEKVRFLRYRPVLDNSKLKTEFGYTPQKTSAEAFEAYVETHPEVVSN